jgi:hypothetical protein
LVRREEPMWLKLSDTARDNEKIQRLAAALGVSYPEALGHLALLWLWRITDGELTGFTAEEIATAARWRGNAGQFFAVLRLAGFIDEVDGRSRLHDHEEHQGSVKEARRKARQRAKKRDVPAREEARPPLSRDRVVSRDETKERPRALSRQNCASPVTDTLDAEIEKRLDALFIAPIQR